MPFITADTITIADAYIETTLRNDSIINTEAPGGVWNETAEQGTTGRLIRYVFLPGETQLETINNTILYEVLNYLVTMVGEEDRFEDLRTGASRIKELLHRTRGVSVNEADVTLGTVLWCRYLGPHKERVPEGDRFYPEMGSVVQIAVQTPESI